MLSKQTGLFFGNSVNGITAKADVIYRNCSASNDSQGKEDLVETPFKLSTGVEICPLSTPAESGQLGNPS